MNNQPEILGLDVATKTGWAIYDGKRVSSIQTGSFKATGNVHEEYAASAGQHLIRLFKVQGRPRFVAIEQPLRNVKSFKKKGGAFDPNETWTINADSALRLNQLVGSIVGILTGYGIPWVSLAPATWRKSFFPNGTKATGTDWKKLARWQCEQLNIDVPNADAAEAVGIAVAAAGTIEYRNLTQRIEA